MKSKNVASGQTGASEQYDALVADAYGASQLLAHQQLGVLGLPTNPSNTQTWTLTINGTGITGHFVTGSVSVAGDVKVGSSAAVTAANLLTLLQNPQTTTATGFALSTANQALLVYCGYALNGTSITIYSQNNSTYAPQTSFTASTTATSGTYTANTMALYVEPGTYYIGITKVIYGGGNTSTFTAPSTHPRIDIVTLDSSGTLAITTGSENVSPTAPAYPANKIVLCEVTHSVGETSIFDNDNQTAGQGFISIDSRNFLAPPYIGDISQVTAGIFLADPGGEAQGAIPFQGASALQFLAAGTAGFVLASQGASANPHWVAPNTKSSFDSNIDATVSVPTGNVETTILSGTVQAMGANDSLLIFASATINNNGSPTIAIELNGTDLFTVSTSTSGQFFFIGVISNRNSTSSQFYQALGINTSSVLTYVNGTGAIATSSPFTLAMTAKQNSGSSQSWTGHQLFILPING